uniref:Uncharacterized protein n=1 Tax=Arundo donax TaxID=35708 RepID=A0A0A9DG33_ARUDO
MSSASEHDESSEDCIYDSAEEGPSDRQRQWIEKSFLSSNPTVLGAIEEALVNPSETDEKKLFEPTLGMRFDSIPDAY